MLKLAAAAAMTAALMGQALAHVSIEPAEAPAESTYKGVLKVGHGCEGAATTSIRVQIPEGVIAVKPMPKAGWELSTKVESYSEPVRYYDQSLTEGVREIAWTGGKLPDDWYDEFVFRARLPKAEPGTVIRFPVVQDCEATTVRWIEVPAEGQDSHDLKEPAPEVTITPAAPHHH
ncbi:DUF1775 domain-containing protein [Tianweitania sediminis]|uniref:DUF1775 domain-containing protein n=2 Tax=Tianweitania sediminis TaxID=1502156 RepID=A0A8J7UK61_9HYPH|nr:DUF1775 domain-containing protein [Tianweitania sediminis]